MARREGCSAGTRAPREGLSGKARWWTCLLLGVGQETADRFRVSRQTKVGAVLAGICQRAPVQEGDGEEAFFKQVKEASRSQALVLTGGPEPPGYLLEGQSSRAQAIEAISRVHFLARVMEESRRGGALLETLYW